MKEEKEKTPLQLMVERMGKELAQAVEEAIAAGAEAKSTIAGGAIVDGVYFGTNTLTHKPTVLLEVPCKTIQEISHKAELDEKRREIERLEIKIKELQQ